MEIITNYFNADGKSDQDTVNKIMKLIWGHPGKINGVTLREQHCSMVKDSTGRVRYHRAEKVGDILQRCKWTSASNNTALYMSKNTFVRMARQYNTNTLFSLKNICIDIDNHNSNPYEVCQQVNLLITEVRQSHETYGIPLPNAVVYTGRGVQIWYCLISASAALAFVANSIVTQICNLYDALLNSLPIGLADMSVDRASSLNSAGLCRVPGSFNPTAHCYSQGLLITNKRWDINALREAVGAEISPHEPHNVTEKCKHTRRNDGKSTSYGRYAALLFSTLEDIAKSRNCMSREVLAHIYHAKLLMYGYTEDDAAQKVFTFNDMFDDPLPEREIRSLIKCNNRHRYHYNSEHKIFEKLGVDTTIKENYFKKKKSLQKPRNYRQENSSRDTDRLQKRIAWHNEIRELAQQGLSISAISRITGHSRATVAKYANTTMENLSAEKTQKRKINETRAQRVTLDEETLRKRAINLTHQGFRSYEKIGRILGISASLAEEYLRDYKIEKKNTSKAQASLKQLNGLLTSINIRLDKIPYGDKASSHSGLLRTEYWALNKRVCGLINDLNFGGKSDKETYASFFKTANQINDDFHHIEDGYEWAKMSGLIYRTDFV